MLLTALLFIKWAVYIVVIPAIAVMLVGAVTSSLLSGSSEAKFEFGAEAATDDDAVRADGCVARRGAALHEWVPNKDAHADRAGRHLRQLRSRQRSHQQQRHPVRSRRHRQGEAGLLASASDLASVAARRGHDIRWGRRPGRRGSRGQGDGARGPTRAPAGSAHPTIDAIRRIAGRHRKQRQGRRCRRRHGGVPLRACASERLGAAPGVR